MFGAFSSYMRSDQCPRIQKLDANLHYLSSVNKTWYTELKRKTCDLYMGDGKKLRDHANGMNDRDLDYLCKELFCLNTNSLRAQDGY